MTSQAISNVGWVLDVSKTAAISKLTWFIAHEDFVV
jgi:hypothetical protein